MFLSKPLSRRHDLTIVALLCALCLCAPLARAQTNNAPVAPPRSPLDGRDMAPIPNAVPIPATAAELRGAPLFWADGITDINDLPAYKSIGLNTVVVRLGWNPNANDLTAVDVAPQRAFAEAAARTGMKVIYALPPAPKGSEFSIRIAGDSTSYNLLWTGWASAAINQLRDTPNLIGWMLPDDPRSLPVWNDESFRSWIGRNYASIEILNTQWGTDYHDLSEVSINDVSDLANRNRGGVAANDALGQLGTPSNPTLTNAAFHPAQLALAAYRLEAYRQLLVSWIGVVRGNDSRHLLFSGELPDYAQMLSMPAGVDVMLPMVSPGIAENDIVTHNPQAIDIARRGGKFAALPIFGVRDDGSVPKEALPELSKRWLQQACARGAVGVAFDSWPALKSNLDLRQSILEKLRALNSAPANALWGEPPVATTAVILAPLADGVTINYGPVAQGGKRGLYGWAENLIDGEPSNLVWALRWGTAFGGVDYLAPEDLSEAPLDLYNTILAPQLLDCSLENQTALTNYVTSGGVLVADLGLGALQSGGQVGILPPAMSLLFGVPGSYDVRPVSFNLKGGEPYPLLPQWANRLQKSPTATLTGGDGVGRAAFGGPTGFSLISPPSTIIGFGPQIGTQVANGRAAQWSAPMTANGAARGTAIFAPFRLWSSWRPGNLGFNDFHGDLMSRGATLAISGNAQGQLFDVTPDSSDAALGATRFPEVINRPLNVTFIDHDAPGQPLQLSSVETTGTGDWLWSGGITQLPNAQGVALTGGRPAPIENASSFETRTRPMGLFAAVAQGEMTNLRMEPISAQNLGGGPLCGQVISNTRAGAEIFVWPNAAQVLPDSDSSAWQAIPTLPGKFRLTVYSSKNGLNWAPGTRVRAVATSYSAAKIRKGDKPKINTDTFDQTAVVDASGRAVWEFEGISVRIQIAGDGK